MYTYSVHIRCFWFGIWYSGTYKIVLYTAVYDIMLYFCWREITNFLFKLFQVLLIFKFHFRNIHLYLHFYLLGTYTILKVEQKLWYGNVLKKILSFYEILI